MLCLAMHGTNIKLKRPNAFCTNNFHRHLPKQGKFPIKYLHSGQLFLLPRPSPFPTYNTIFNEHYLELYIN
jgi:hypothetical protein